MALLTYEAVLVVSTHPPITCHVDKKRERGRSYASVVVKCLLRSKFTKSAKLMPRSHQTFRSVLAVKLLGIMPKMPTDGVGTARCDRPLTRNGVGLCEGL